MKKDLESHILPIDWRKSEIELLLLMNTIGKSELLIIIILKRNSEQYWDMKIKSVSESDILIRNNKSERVL